MFGPSHWGVAACSAPFVKSGWLRTFVAVVVLLSVVACGSAVAADPDIFVAQSLSPEGKVILSRPLQFDGVGSCELMVLTREQARGRRLLLFHEASARSFEPTPALAVDVPRSVFAVETIDIDNDRRDEIVLLGLESIHVIDFDDGGFAAPIKEAARFDRLFAVPPPEFVADYSFMFDLNSDRMLEAVVPCWDGIRVLKRDRTGYTLVKSITVEHRCAGLMTGNLLSEPGTGDFAVSLPTIAVQDLNTDRTNDILVASGSGLSVCHQVGDMQFDSVPNQVLEVRAVFLENLRFTSWGLADLNNDKVIDYCRVFTQGKQDEFKTILEIFLGNAQAGYPQRPSKRIVLDQYGVGMAVADLDGDGAASVILATVGVSPTSLVKSLLMKRMPVELNIYEADGGVFAEQAKFTKKINCAIDFFGNGLPTKYIGCLDGDLDHDRINDLVSISDDDELEVYRGSKNPHFSDKPVATRAAQRLYSVDAHDLNLDGKADLIMLGWDEDGRDQVTLLWSK